jgi:signal transduction histidine kinase
MEFPGIRERLLPREERDPKFRDYLQRLSVPGVQIVAIMEIFAALLLLLFGRIAGGSDKAAQARGWQTAALVGVGAATLVIAHHLERSKHARLLAAVSAWLAVALLLVVSAWQSADVIGAGDYILAAATLVVISLVAAVPLLPWHALTLGLTLEGVYILCCTLAVKWGIAPISDLRETHHIFLLLLALLATGISILNYDRHCAEFAANREAVRIAEALAGAQLRAQLAENAISVGKMAAALSHEINSPLGTLRSSVETLMSLTDRQIESPEQRERLAGTREELCRSIQESAARIDEVTRRLRRFVTLEDAELKSADINELLADVALLHQEEIRAAHVRVVFELEATLPALNCRPQLLSAVFSTLLSNAIHAVNGDGRIGIETHSQEGELEVTVRDNGRGMSEEEAVTIFDPSFKVAEGRVASANWSLFNSRQIVYEHGGDIRLETAEGEGTAVHVTLPQR